MNVRHELRLDRVLMVVANQPWQKSGRVVAAAEDRLAMVEASVDGVEGLEASRLELDRTGPSYTADTLEELAARPGQPELFLIVGADAAGELETWRRIESIRSLATLVVVTRAGWDAPVLEHEWRVEHVRIPRLEISSTELRQRPADGRP